MSTITLSQDLAEMHCTGHAKKDNQGILLAGYSPNAPKGTAGAAWWPLPLIINRDFEIQIRFSLAHPGGLVDHTGVPGGEGLALTFQNYGPSYVGSPGSQLGYGKFRPFGMPEAYAIPAPELVALEIDTFVNNEMCMPGTGTEDIGFVGKHMAIQYQSPHAYSLLAEEDLPHLGKEMQMGASSEEHTLRIYYRASDGLMVCWMDEDSINARKMSHRFQQRNLNALVGREQGCCYVGVTASTGRAWQDHRLLDFNVRGITKVHNPKNNLT